MWMQPLYNPPSFPNSWFFHVHSLLPFVTLSSQDKETGYLGTDVLAFLHGGFVGFLGKRLTVTPVMPPPRYVTRHLLAMPIIDFEGSCLGVIQAINKHHGGWGKTCLPLPLKEGLKTPAKRRSGHGFEPADEIMLNTLAEQVSVALHNAEFYRAAIITSERANAAWQVSRKRRKWPVICIHQWFGVMGCFMSSELRPY